MTLSPISTPNGRSMMRLPTPEKELRSSSRNSLATLKLSLARSMAHGAYLQHASNFYHIWFFASDDDKTAYLADPEGNASLRLSDEVIPISTVQGDSFGSYLFSDVLSTTNYVVSGGSFKIKLRFSSVRTSNGERLKMGARG